jgi:hypothetical protein
MPYCIVGRPIPACKRLKNNTKETQKIHQIEAELMGLLQASFATGSSNQNRANPCPSQIVIGLGTWKAGTPVFAFPARGYQDDGRSSDKRGVQVLRASS